MQIIIGAFPFEKGFGEEVGETRERLVEVDQAETDIKDPGRLDVAGKQDNTAYYAEYDMKDIVGGRAARQASIGGNDKPENSNQYKQRCEEKQNVVVQVFHGRIFAGEGRTGSTLCSRQEGRDFHRTPVAIGFEGTRELV
jgi:hypothetical protein